LFYIRLQIEDTSDWYSVLLNEMGVDGRELAGEIKMEGKPGHIAGRGWATLSTSNSSHA
jgi:hypothetical protein